MSKKKIFLFLESTIFIFHVETFHNKKANSILRLEKSEVLLPIEKIL